MQFASSGRIVVVAQWILAVLLPAFVFIGRGFVGAELGWMSVIGLFYGWILILLLLVPPIASLFDRAARLAGTVREGYAIASALLWLCLLYTSPSPRDS